MTTTKLQQELLDKGYSLHKTDFYKVLHMTDTLFQKRVKDGNGTKYFINAWYYPEDLMMNESLQFEVQFRFSLTNGDKHYIDISTCGKDIPWVESEYELMWNKMGYDYYESYSEED